MQAVIFESVIDRKKRTTCCPRFRRLVSSRRSSSLLCSPPMAAPCVTCADMKRPNDWQKKLIRSPNLTTGHVPCSVQFILNLGRVQKGMLGIKRRKRVARHLSMLIESFATCLGDCRNRSALRSFKNCWLGMQIATNGFAERFEARRKTFEHPLSSRIPLASWAGSNFPLVDYIQLLQRVSAF